MTFDLIVAVKILGQGTPIFAGLTYLSPTEYEMHANAGPAYYRIKQSDIEIVKQYTYTCEDDIAVAEDDFIKEFGPKPQPLCARLGWLSPTGDWFPCAYTAHRDLAYFLSCIYYGTDYGESTLEKNGWIGIKGGGIIAIKERDGIKSVTEVQKQFLKDLTELAEQIERDNPEYDWTPVLTANPENYTLQFWSRKPGYDDITQETFAESLRDSYELYCGDNYMEFSRAKFAEKISKRPGNHPGD